MSTQAKILIRVQIDRTEKYSVVLFDTMTEGRVEIDCKNQAAAETLIGVLMVVGSDVEIQPTESNSINVFVREEDGEGRLICLRCSTSILERLDESSEPEGIRKDAHCTNCGSEYAVHKSGLIYLGPHISIGDTDKVRNP